VELFTRHEAMAVKEGFVTAIAFMWHAEPETFRSSALFLPHRHGLIRRFIAP
jgi:hypothetical protein